MTQATTSAVRASLALAAVAIFAALAPRVSFAQATPPAAPATASAFAKIQGYVIDSVHSAPLTNAVVLVEGTERSTTTDADGHYLLDSIPVGTRRLLLLAPLLDTLGVGQMRTPPITFAAGDTHTLDMAIPSAERLVGILCTPAQRMRGPAAMVGFVRDPETKGPAIGAEVQIVYYITDLAGRKMLRTGSATVDSTGMYRICGLAKDMDGKVQVYRNKVSSGEVPVAISNGFLALRGFTVASHQTVVEVKGDSGKVRRVAKGAARVTGRVVDKTGKPLVGARVQLQGGLEVTITKGNGVFELDSLPTGTQALEVRKLGYSVAEVPVELSNAAAAKTTVTMTDAAPLLETMRVEAQVDKGLSKVGYLERKQSGFGYFFDGKQINHQAHLFSDVMRVSPGLIMQPTGDGRTNVIRDSRNQQNGCVNFYVDNSPYQEMTPGDIDDYVRPDEIVAVEVYHGTETPPQFTKAGGSSCATIVIWTQARVGTRSNKSP
ncbi:MAG TPA: carboxypeptidase regulatory-like domain-containing protein [Gemmatimonadaceae bacterium]|nr:carboxypeptidase regulatory-like domain-containing protein [Gemmatimonadaceae bacterium]